MKKLEVARFGPLRDASVEFGDLTVLVGPQATGKSLFVQLAKAIADAGAIRNDLKSHGFDWLHGKDPVADYSSLYFGGGLEGLLREFTPLLLSMVWLMPPASAARREKLNTVVIEEPEMGLHPSAILGFTLLVLVLLHRKYRVIISTHSPSVLDVVWALRSLRETSKCRAVGALRAIFEIAAGDNQLNATFRTALESALKVHYFDRHGSTVTVRDISTLDPSSTDEAAAGWGGLSGFSGRIADIVGSTISHAGRA